MGTNRRCPGARTSAIPMPMVSAKRLNSTSRADSDRGEAAGPTMSRSSDSSSRRKRPGANRPRPGVAATVSLPAASVVALGDRHLHGPARLELRVDRGAVGHRGLRRIPAGAAAPQHLGDGLAGTGLADAQPALEEPPAVRRAQRPEGSRRLLEARAVAAPVAGAGAGGPA